MIYTVKYEVRAIGAIGVFWPMTDEIEAWTAEQARERFRAKHQDKYEFRFPISVLDERNTKIMGERQVALDAVKGPRVGDYVRFANGIERRISYIWDFGDDSPTNVQTSDGGSFFLGYGYVSFSGSLYNGVPGPTLTITDEKKLGRAWFFDHDLPGAGRGVQVTVGFRMYLCSLDAEMV